LRTLEYLFVAEHIIQINISQLSMVAKITVCASEKDSGESLMKHGLINERNVAVIKATADKITWTRSLDTFAIRSH
jgi:hypothetical protein